MFGGVDSAKAKWECFQAHTLNISMEITDITTESCHTHIFIIILILIVLAGVMAI